MNEKKRVPEETCKCSAPEGLHLNSCKSHKFASYPDVAVSSKSPSFQQNHASPTDNFANAVTHTVGLLLCQWLVLLASMWSNHL
jgi:hypothetical protein